MRLDYTNEKADLIKYYTDLANKDIKNFDSEQDKEFYRIIQDKDNLNAYVEELVEQNLTIINYFVHPDFITQVLPKRSGDQEISFTYKEWINKHKPADSDYTEFLHNRTSTGYMYNLEMASMYADTIVYLPQYSGKTTLDDNEVLISVEHAKVILSGDKNRLYKDISDEEAIAAIGMRLLDTAMLKLDGEMVNAKIVGYYDRENNDWLTWNDKDYSAFSASHVGNMHRYEIAPFIVSDRLYNNDRQYDSNAVGYIANFEYLDLDAGTLKYLAHDLSQFSFTRNTVVWQVVYFHSTYKYNSDLIKPVWMYAALFMAILCVIAVLSYVWAVIHDSKRKIGVLRAQGMNSLSIAAIYLIETMVACLIAISIGICLTLLLSNWESLQGFPQKFTVFDFKTNYFGIKEILSVFGFGMGIGVLGSIAPIVFNARKSPVSIIRSKNN